MPAINPAIGMISTRRLGTLRRTVMNASNTVYVLVVSPISVMKSKNMNNEIKANKIKTKDK
jgi:hypothetical protein